MATNVTGDDAFDASSIRLASAPRTAKAAEYTLRLDLGEGITRDAYFDFTR